MSNKRIISCAVTGSIHTPSMSPYLPVTPEQIAQACIDAANAGAASVHIHARIASGEKYGAPTSDPAVFSEIIDRIRAVNKDVIICTTTGGGTDVTIKERTQIIRAKHPELASMNAGSMNWGIFQIAANPKMKWQYGWEKAYFESTYDWVFTNTFKGLVEACQAFNEAGTKPELECYDIGHIYNVKWLLDNGYLKGKPYLQFVTGVSGGIGGRPEDMAALKAGADRILGEGQYHFSGFGAGKWEYQSCTQSLLLGGHCRVGMEDNLYLSKGVPAKSNGEMVEKMARIMREFDFEPATPDEARTILGLSK